MVAFALRSEPKRAPKRGGNKRRDGLWAVGSGCWLGLWAVGCGLGLVCLYIVVLIMNNNKNNNQKTNIIIIATTTIYNNGIL